MDSIPFLSKYLSDIILLYHTDNDRDLKHRLNQPPSPVKTAYGTPTSVIEILKNSDESIIFHLNKAIHDKKLPCIYCPSNELISLTPIVFGAIENRVPLNIIIPLNTNNELNTLLSLRQKGLSVLIAPSKDEVNDLMVISRLIANLTKSPSILVYDSTTDTVNQSSINENTVVKIISQYQAEFDPYSFTSSKTTSTTEKNNLQQLYISSSSSQMLVSDFDLTEAFLRATNTFAEHTGKIYCPFQYIGTSNPDIIIISTGATATWIVKVLSELSMTNETSIGVLNVIQYRPWSLQHFKSSLPAPFSKMIVVENSTLDNNEEVNVGGGGLYLDVISSFYSNEWGNVAVPDQVIEAIVELTYPISNATSTLQRIIDNAISSSCKSPFLIQGNQTNSTVDQLQTNMEKNLSLEETPPEAAYLKVLSQVFKSRLYLANVPEYEKLSSSIMTESKPTIPKLMKSDKSVNMSTAEYGFGIYLGLATKREKLVQTVLNVLNEKSNIPVSKKLSDALAGWIKIRDDGSKSVQVAEEIRQLLDIEKNNHVILKDIYDNRELLTYHSRWLLGGTQCAFDVGHSGVHHVISSGQNINMLIIDTTLPQAHIDKRKRDLGLYAMTYGGVYVASVAIHASYPQLLRALLEADAYPGPSIVLAYAPQPDSKNSPSSHKIRHISSLTTLRETKSAVDSGFWPLYRWNPSASSRGMDPFSLDSERIKTDLKDFLDRSNHLSLISKSQPTFSSLISQSLESESQSLLRQKTLSTYSGLMNDLNAIPLLILYGSDGGNAEKVAKKIASEGKQRKLKTKLLCMDDMDAESIVVQSNVVFVVSTAGQGEFPSNARECWKSIKNPPSDLNWNELHYSVFGLGDSKSSLHIYILYHFTLV